jgi:hypothetical protein
MSDQKQIDALLIERAGYARRGLADRVKVVDAALKASGYEAPRESKPAAARGQRDAKA